MTTFNIGTLKNYLKHQPKDIAPRLFCCLEHLNFAYEIMLAARDTPISPKTYSTKKYAKAARISKSALSSLLV